MKRKPKPQAPPPSMPRETPHTCQFCRWRYTEIHWLSRDISRFGYPTPSRYVRRYYCRYNPPQPGNGLFPAGLGFTEKDSTCSKWEKDVTDATEAPKAEKLPDGVRFTEGSDGDLFPDLPRG